MALFLQSDVDALIEKLGDEKPAARDEASKDLKKLGKKALDALRKAAEHKDPEIAVRAKALIEEIDWPEPGPAVDGLAIAIKAKSEYKLKEPILLRGRLINVSDRELSLDKLNTQGESHAFLLDFDKTKGLHLCFLRTEPRPDMPDKLVLKPGEVREFTFSPRAWCAYLGHSECGPLAVAEGKHGLLLSLLVPQAKSNEVTFTVKP